MSGACGRTWSSRLVAADAHATLTGENAEDMRRLREEFEPDLKDLRRRAVAGAGR